MLSRGVLVVSLLVIGCAQNTLFPSLEGDDAELPDPMPQPNSDESEIESDESESESDEEEDSSDDSGITFIVENDIGGCSCDPFAQDCPDGEKCVPYASSGGTFDANKCVPVTGTGEPGDPCSYSSPLEATDDCNALGICWGVQNSMGICAEFCGGTADAPVCPEGFVCLIGYEGSVVVCVPEASV